MKEQKFADSGQNKFLGGTDLRLDFIDKIHAYLMQTECGAPDLGWRLLSRQRSEPQRACTGTLGRLNRKGYCCLVHNLQLSKQYFPRRGQLCSLELTQSATAAENRAQ